jgi:multidrug resistance efflux pump
MAKKTTPPARTVAVAVRHPIKAATLLYSAPKFVLRGPIYLMFITMFCMLFYSFVATTDTLVVAPLTLQRQTVTVQAISGGLVDSLDVSENSAVTVGQAIATVQEKIRAASTPEQEAIDRQIKDYEDRLTNANRDYDYRRHQLESSRDELQGRLTTGKGSLSDRIDQLNIQLNTAQRNHDNIMSDLARFRQLCANRDVPSSKCDDLQRAASNAQADIENIRLSLTSANRERNQQSDQSTLERMKQDIDKARDDHDNEVKQINERIADLQDRRRQAQTLVPGVRYGQPGPDQDHAHYSSIVDGIVTTVHVQRGQLVNPGSPLVTIVRNSAPLEARVLVQNKDIGLLKIGQSVKIKYFAYPFQEYGIQKGSISDISVRPSNAAGEANLFVVNVALESETVHRQPVQPGDSGKSLEIGLTGTAEIKTGDKRFIELLFTPASKFFQAEPPAPPAEATPAAAPKT